MSASLSAALGVNSIVAVGVQGGEFQLSGGFVDVPVAAVNTSKYLLILNGVRSNTAVLSNTLVTARLTSATNVRLQQGVAPSDSSTTYASFLLIGLA